MKINILAFFFSIMLFSACTEEVVNTLTYPTTFTFNTPVLESRSVHSIDTFTVVVGSEKRIEYNVKELTENLGTFDRSNSLVSDTLNHEIRKSFYTKSLRDDFPLRIKNGSMITSITLISANEMKISYGILDTLDSKNPLLDRIISTIDTTLNYTPNGNFILPGLYLNNDSRELYLCNEFIYAGKRGTAKPRIYEYKRRLSNGPILNESLSRIIFANGPLKYDTLSVEYVNFIFSSYK